jgi:hypothetical protein
MRPVAMDGTVTFSDRVVIAGTAMFDSPDVATKVDGLVKASFGQIKAYIERGDSHVDGAAVHVDLSVSGGQLQQLLGNF